MENPKTKNNMDFTGKNFWVISHTDSKGKERYITFDNEKSAMRFYYLGKVIRKNKSLKLYDGQLTLADPDVSYLKKEFDYLEE